MCARERRDDAKRKDAYVEGDGEAVAVSVDCYCPFEKRAVAGRFDVVGECAGVLQDGLEVEERVKCESSGKRVFRQMKVGRGGGGGGGL